VFWLGCCCDHIVSKEKGRFPVTYFKMDTYNTFFNKHSDVCKSAGSAFELTYNIYTTVY
jgi:hypothetical protein